jgi:hypothetical protein
MSNSLNWQFSPVWQPASARAPVTQTGGIDREALLREYYTLLPGGTGNAQLNSPSYGGGHSESMQATGQRLADSQLQANTMRRAALEQMLGLAGGGPSSTDWVQQAFQTALGGGQSGSTTGTPPTTGGTTTLDGIGGLQGTPSAPTLPTHTNPYEGRLAALLDDPSRIQQSAGYQFRVGQGQEALQRSLGARGMLNSGNRLMALTRYGQDMASQEYDTQLQRLSALLMGRDQTNAQRYGSDRTHAASLYQTDRTAENARYNTDRTFDASRYNATLSALASLARPSMEAAAGNQSYGPRPVSSGGSRMGAPAEQTWSSAPLYGNQGFTDQASLRRAYGIPEWTYTS